MTEQEQELEKLRAALRLVVAAWAGMDPRPVYVIEAEKALAR